MAVATGTATDWLNLLNLLRTFLTTNSALVTAGQQWTQVAGPGGAITSTDEIVLRGPGLAGADQVFVGVSQSTSVSNDYYNWVLHGLVSHNPALPIASQANTSGGRTLTLWQSSIPYWFIANGRRFIVVARVSTVYVCCYCGFILPYCEPTSWPYPMFVGASGSEPTRRWSASNEARHSSFFSPGESGAALCFNDTVWRNFVNRPGSGASEGNPTNRYVYPSRAFPGGGGSYKFRDNVDGSYTLLPTELMARNDPYNAILGTLQGVFMCSGFGQASENIQTVGAISHLLVQNIYRTAADEYAAIRME